MIATRTFTPRPYQREASDRSVKFLTNKKSDKHGLLILPTGSGKSIVIADVVKGLDAPSLVLQPSREILRQNCQKLIHYGFHPAIYSASLGRKTIGSGVTLATIGSVVDDAEHFDHVKYVLIDECFPAGTLIDGRPIETIRPGDEVTSYSHRTGEIERKTVAAVSKRTSDHLRVRVTLENETTFTCTANHPVFVAGRGYVPAITLHTWDSLICYEPAKDSEYVMQQMSSASPDRRKPSKKLHEDRAGLLPGQTMREENPARSVDSQRENGAGIKGMERKSLTQDEATEPDAITGEHRQDGCFNEGPDVSRSRRQWATDQTAIEIALGDRPTNGICDPDTDPFDLREVRISSEMLQGRSCGTDGETGDRGGWANSPTEEVEISGQAENRNLKRVRVVSLEIYKRRHRSGSSELHRDDHVYNLEVKDNHNYFANGVLVHNCHLVNPAEGMYRRFFDALRIKQRIRILGLTATPYRLSSTMQGPMLKFLTRTKDKVFSEVVYYVQNEQLFREGHLAQLQYHQITGFDKSKLQANSTGAEYTEESIKREIRSTDFAARLERIVRRLLAINRTGVLVFTRFLEESHWLASRITGATVVSAETPDAERDRILKDFKAGKIKVVCNVGVLTTGFDYPELDTVVLARPTMSLALYYQMVGRCIRPHPSKSFGMVVDMVGLQEQFGRVEDLRIEHRNKNYYVASGGKQLTNVIFGQARH